MSGKRMSEIIERFIRDAGTDSPEFYSDKHLQGIYRSTLNGNDTIFSYGPHFPLAEIMPNASGNRRGWWLLNGDRWSGGGGWGQSTSGQQSEVQRLVRGTGLPYLIVPFSALSRAGIKHDSIRIVDQLRERYTWEPRTRDKEPSEYEQGNTGSWRNWQQLTDGRWSHETSVHHLGESLFEADWQSWHREPAYMDLETHRIVHPEGHTVTGTAYFLSAFDENEPGFGLYFLAQLPEGAEPSTVAEAREALKPDAVKAAERTGLEVLRQGDVFAIAHPELKTRDLAVPTLAGAYVLGVNHTVTDVRIDFGNTYGRGFMRHRPREFGRRPEHRTLKLGNGKDWYALYRNTVPEGRSWSVGGQVD
jgi:hypothetical protein